MIGARRWLSWLSFVERVAGDWASVMSSALAGLLLSVRHPFEPNDLVSIDGDEGKVVRLTSRSTVLLTLAGNHLRIPNPCPSDLTE